MGQQRQDPTAEALVEAFEVLDTGLGNRGKLWGNMEHWERKKTPFGINTFEKHVKFVLGT